VFETILLATRESEETDFKPPQFWTRSTYILMGLRSGSELWKEKDRIWELEFGSQNRSISEKKYPFSVSVPSSPLA
jgi:hypothetical protein